MEIKLRYIFRLAKAFVIRFRLILFAGVIFGLLMFSVLRFLYPYFFSSKTELIGSTGRYHVEELPNEILLLIGEGLTKVDEKGIAGPGLAESWESDEDGKVWTFHLDESKRWHDNSTLKSSDIDYKFEDADVEYVDDKTIVFRLNSAFAPFPVVVSRPVFKRGLLGTGEWRVRNLSLNNQFVEELSLLDELGNIRLLKFYPTEESTKIAFQLGEIDIVKDLIDPSPFENWDTVIIKEESNNNRFAAVFFNTQADPFKENKPFRQAMSYAIDKSTFANPRALGPISPDSWVYNSQTKDYVYDPDRAKELLEDMPDAILSSTVTLTTSPVLLETAEVIEKYWEEIGIDTNIEVVPILPEDYQAFLAIYNMPLDPDQYSIWHSTQEKGNISNFSSPRINKLLEDGRLELNEQERKRIYLDFQRFLLEEAPAAFLYHPISYTVVRK